MHRRAQRWLSIIGRLWPAAGLYATIGCLPDNAFAQVTAENVILTSALVIQNITSIIFSNFFFLF